MPIRANKRHYDFRVLLETNKGKQFSHISQSFFNENNTPNFALSSSDAWHRITGSVSCSYQTGFIFSGSLGSDNFNQAYNQAVETPRNMERTLSRFNPDTGQVKAFGLSRGGIASL